MSDVALSASQRSSLLSLQNTQTLSERTQNRLATGREVNTVVDDAVKYFRAKALTDRSADFDLKKDGIDQGISTLNTSLHTISAVDKLLKQMKGIVEAAKSQSTEERQAASSQFEEVGVQIYQLIEDGSYAGVNLSNSTSAELKVSFGIRTDSFLTTKGVDLTNSAGAASGTLFSINAFSGGGLNINMASGGFGLGSAGSFTVFGANNSNLAAAEDVIGFLDTGISRLRARGAELGGNVAILQTRLDFTSTYVTEHEIGADKLTLADLNEEGANLIALQTRQQLGIQSLSIAGQQQQAILTLIR